MKQIDWSKAPEWADRAGYVGGDSFASLVWAHDNMYAYADPGTTQRAYSFSDSSEHSTGCFSLKDLHNVQYRPTKTESDKAIEQMSRAEAYSALSEMRTPYLTESDIAAILCVLGYKE